MGAAQSASSARDRNEPVAAVKTSYYELLEIERQATDLEIKKAYRRKALELHPDRNYGNVEEATRLFADVQTAYEVLSDPQERAWYDSHESAILRGDDVDTAAAESYDLHDTKFASGDDVTRLLGKFGGSVAFTDEPTGFFGFLRQTFAQLAQEEEHAAARQQSLDAVDIPDYPTFGTKSDTHDHVVKSFYAAWAGFATRKSFAWRDKYKLSEAPDRRYKRLMEKENRKFREEGIRDFNDAVRSLIAFVRKRDPRYRSNAQSEAERQQTLRDAAASQSARARAANQAALAADMPAWAQNSGNADDAEDDEQQGTFEDSEDEDVVEEFDCVACNKTFKSQNQWEAHERSKKHQKTVKALRKQMRQEGADLDLDDETASRGSPVLEEVGNGHDLNVQSGLDPTPGMEHLKIDDESDDAQPVQAIETAELANQDDNAREHPRQRPELDPDGDDEQTTADRSESEEDTNVITALPLSDDESSAPVPKQKMGKAAQKRAKKAAAAAAAAASADAQENKVECATCHAAFPSKTRLFQHIKDHGHAALRNTGAGVNKKGRKG